MTNLEWRPRETASSLKVTDMIDILTRCDPTATVEFHVPSNSEYSEIQVLREVDFREVKVVDCTGIKSIVLEIVPR